MKQILQDLKNGDTRLVDVPVPAAGRGNLLIKTSRTLLSAGTERMLLEFGKAGWLDKARQQPDKVKQVLDKVKTDGLMPTLEAVQSKLDQPLPLGYCNAGVVVAVGDDVEGFSVGDRVASNGNHAGYVRVPPNLCARIPDDVDDESAAFTVIGAIALQGIRLAAPTLGETFVVTGLGLIGLLTVQLLRAQGCRVLGLDYDPAKLALARQFGAETVDLSQGEDPLVAAQAFSRDRGVDGVLITASTKSNEPASQAAKMCRKRGRIVLVGVIGLELSRADFFEKELTFQVSCSYGPGRYDPLYEEKGQDYPVGFVRWTEQRNFEAVLDMLASGGLDIKPLVSHRFPIAEAEAAYSLLTADEPYLGILLEYLEEEGADAEATNIKLPKSSVDTGIEEVSVHDTPGQAAVGFIGAGNYAGRVLMPAFKNADARLHVVASSGGVSGVHYGKKYGFSEATTEVDAILNNPQVNTVVVATRHNTHARFVCDALSEGKNVFVEKPLALTHSELNEIEEAYRQAHVAGNGPLLMVGFNRRFAPQVQKIKELLCSVKEPKSFIMTINAGEIPADHWTQDSQVGGGRIIGEACHFVDLLRLLAGSSITGVTTTAVGKSPGIAVRSDKVTFTLQFEDGSFGTVHYLANGAKSFPKERLEVFCAGRVLQLDNFRKLKGYGWPGFRKMNLMRQDKGQAACVVAFVDAVQAGSIAPIAFDELLEISRTTIDISDSIV